MVLDITNRTRDRAHVYWVDYSGKRVEYGMLEPDQGYEQWTYVTHPWMIVDRTGRCLGIAVPMSVQTDPTTLTVVGS